MDRRLGIIGVVAAGLLAGAAMWWWSEDGQRPAPRAAPTSGEGEAAAPAARPSAEPAATLPAVRPLPPHADEVLSDTPVPALVRAGPQAGDDPAQRERLEQQAVLAGPYWAKLAPRLSDPELRAAATGVFTSLQTLDRPAAELAAEQYELTQSIITAGGLDRGTQAMVDYLNSTAAAVLQGGDPAEIPLPGQAGARPPRRR